MANNESAETKSKPTIKGGTKVMRCSCKHEFQDERHGSGMRVHNRTTSGKGGWRCTVCLNELDD
jgi:hypothetical protein